ncbi:MAG: hypothetical protein KatS3mg001_434 [Candidatus Pacearchaeota archaeon]|nr:MAG: hypothetical protein KatS3mg001_434 [Candidatus Pacearchaeota archaeon]
MKKRTKKSQMQISFGMIISIILIIFFLIFGFYGIRAFLRFQDNAKAGNFIKELQADVDTAWKSSQSSEVREYFIPTKYTKVCFVDFSVPSKGKDSLIYVELKKVKEGSENMVFYPIKHTGIDSASIKNINIEEITSEENPYCINSNGGKIKIRILKEFTDRTVSLERA